MAKSQIIQWGFDNLDAKGCAPKQPPEIVIETPWSTVIRFSTASGSFYLKQTPKDLFIEPEIIKAIQKNMPNSPTPAILFENHEANCFLMNSCGDHSLRTKFNGTIEPELLFKGLKSYIMIMRSFEHNLDGLLAMGVPDWRIERIPALYVELLEKKDMLQAEGLASDEIDKLMQLAPKIRAIGESIVEGSIKETLMNGDFNENNLIIDESTQQISIIDWGESVISHPFLSVAAHMRNNARRYKLEMEGPLLNNLKQKCLSCWLDIANMSEIDRTYENIQRLLPIFSALALDRLQVATQNKSKEKQNWFIAGCLRTLLENEK